jgi:thiamine biosynthesis lipoprotein
MALSRRELIASGGSVLLVSTLPALGAETLVLDGPAFGSSWRLVAGGTANRDALRSAFEEIIASVDRSMSPFLTDSELSRFNRASTTDWQPLSADLCQVVNEGLRVGTLTSGAFNPTVGPLVGKFGFGPIRDGGLGVAKEIAVRKGAARKARPELSLDLCGIAKGYALDRMAAACVDQGLSDFLLEVGGEVVAKGRHPSGRFWQVAIERPVEGSTAFQRLVVLDGASLATSGDKVNSYLYRGRRYSHIIDPLTGEPVQSALASVTVVASHAVTADALATALFAMGAERGPAFAQDARLEALFVMREGKSTRELATAGFEARILA